VAKAVWKTAESLPDSKRGHGGFGSTGIGTGEEGKK
jgi:dUTPase